MKPAENKPTENLPPLTRRLYDMIQPGAGLPPLKVVTVKLDPVLDDKVEEHCFHQKRKKQDVLRDALLLYFETFRELEEAPPAQAAPIRDALMEPSEIEPSEEAFANPSAGPSLRQKILEDLQREPVVRKTIDIPASLNERLQEYCAAKRIKTERRVFLVLLESFLEEEGF